MSDASMLNHVQPDIGGRQTLAVGQALVRIDSIEESKGYESGTSLIVEVTVHHHINPADPPESLRKISITDLDSRKKKAEMQWARVKKLLAVLWDIDPHQPTPGEGWTWESLYTHTIGPDQPKAGHYFSVSSYDKDTKNINPETRQPYKFRMWTFEPMPKE